jgi:chromosome segregation ATPase
VAAEQREAEKTAGTLAKIQGEVRALESQTALIAERRTRLAEQFSSLKDGVEAASKALAKAQQERHLLQVGLEALHRKRERLLQQKRRAEEEAMEVLGRQASVEKGASEVHRDIQALRRQIHETEQAIEDAKNEMARIRVDALNTEAHNRELGATLEEFTRELRDKDKLVEKYEQEIRQRNDAIEKKQIYIVRLNRRYEQLVSSREEDECTGPLEATIAHLQKEIRNKETESGALQKQWIRGQTDLVAQLAQLEQQEVRAEELRAKEKVVAFRNARLESELRRDAEDVKAMQHDIRNMHQSFARVNELIAKNRQLAEELSRNVASEESAFREKLRELEAESTRLGARVAAVKEEKERLLAEVVEIERQILLWDKKIALERETQDALDPEYGQHELKGLRKEVHRMELRLGQLQRQQERLVGEMERAIVKQESIKLSHISSKSREHVTQASLRQDIVHLKLAIKQQAAESKRAASEVARQEEENRTLLAQLEKLRHEGEAMAEAKTRLDALLTEEQLTRQVALESTRLQQRRAQRLAEARDLKVRRSAIGSEQSLRERIATEDATAAKLVDVVAQLESADPRLARVAAQLKAFAAL